MAMSMGVILLGVLVVLVVLGVPVAFAIAVASICAIISGDFELIAMPQKILAGLDSFPMLAIPFFVLAGNLMTGGGINDRIMRFAAAIAGWVRGSLGIITVISSAIFAAISGSGTATVTAIGGMMIPSMKKKGYPPEFAAAIASSASILGPIIPPSIILIVYGNAVQFSVKDLFVGSAIPGVLLAGAFVVVTYFKAKKLNLPVERRMDVGEISKEIKSSVWALLMPVIILGGIFGGIFTPTEAAAVSVVYAFIIGAFVYRNINLSNLEGILVDSCITSAIMLFLVGCSKISSWALAVGKVPAAISGGILSVTSNTVLLLFILNIFLLIVGMFMEANVAVVIFTPILLPIAKACGMSVLTFGVMMCVNLCLGLLTPPVGLCAMLGNSIAGCKLEQTLKECVTYFLVGFVILLFLTYWKPLTMWLPAVLK
jgi:tripartite ATP-independent transporter DctM subunit